MAYNIDYEKDIIYNIDIDIHHKILIPTISAKQYDENARYLVFTVWDNGQSYVIPEGTTVMFCTTKPDLHGVANACEIINGKVVYKLTLQTTIVHGNFPAELRFYRTALGESKAYATPDFNIHIGKSALLDDTILSSDEVNVLTELIADATDSIAKMTSALTAESGRVSAENIRVTNENTRKTNETNRATAESSRVTVENARVTAENTRKTNETTRGTNETARQTAETGRVTVESTRVTDENTRKSQETTRQTNETTRQSQETTRQNFYNAYKVLETYNNTKAYVVGNKVTYLGGHYQNILASTGVPPTYNTDNANWKCIGAKGADGTGVGDMLGNIYDTTNKKTDVFAYIDNKTITSTDTNLGLVKGNGNVEVRTDGAMWADPYKDKLSNASSTFLTCPTSDDALIHIKKIEGETKQVVTTKNKNVFPRFKNQTLNGITTTVSEDGTVTMNGTATASVTSVTADFKGVLPSGAYTLSANNPVANGNVQVKVATNIGGSIYNGVYTALNIVNKTATATVEEGSPQYVQIYVATGTVLTNFVLKPQLELGSTATTYEPFTPNSPSVEYPSPLLYAKDFDVYVSGKNTFNINAPIANKSADVTDVKINGNIISVTSNNTTSYSKIDYVLDVALYKGKSIVLSHTAMSSSVSGISHIVQMQIKVNGASSYYGSTVSGTAISVPLNASSITLQIQTNNISVAPNTPSVLTVTGIQVEFVSKSAYDDYKGVDKANISFPFMGVPLAKNSHEIVNSVFTSRVRVKEIIFNGTESWVKSSNTGADRFVLRLPDAKDSASHISTHFIAGSEATTIIGQSNINTNKDFYVNYTAYGITTIEQWKSLLAQQYANGTPLTVQYQLASTIVTEIPFIYLKSFKGTTHLLTTSDPQVNMTADFKSELWSRDYLQDVALKSKFDATSQIEFVEATVDIDIATKDTIPTLWGKVLKRFNTIKSNIGTLTSLTTTVKTSLVNAINELVTSKINVTDIINNDTTGGTGKVASAETVKVLGQEVDTINNNLAMLGTYESCNIISSNPQGGYVITSMIPLLNASSKSITITKASVPGTVTVLTTEQISLIAIRKTKNGFSFECGDATVNGIIGGKAVSVTFTVS